MTIVHTKKRLLVANSAGLPPSPVNGCVAAALPALDHPHSNPYPIRPSTLRHRALQQPIVAKTSPLVGERRNPSMPNSSTRAGAALHLVQSCQARAVPLRFACARCPPHGSARVWLPMHAQDAATHLRRRHHQRKIRSPRSETGESLKDLQRRNERDGRDNMPEWLPQRGLT